MDGVVDDADHLSIRDGAADERSNVERVVLGHLLLLV